MSKILKSIYDKLIEVGNIINQAASKEIEDIKALFYLGDIPMGSNSIIIIQGKTGSHKSRLAEAIITDLLAHINNTNSSVNILSKISTKDLYLLLVDTEPNYHRQLPKAIRNIRKNAALNPNVKSKGMYVTSLINIDRKDRLSAIQKLIDEIRKTYKTDHIILFLDILTDCITDFNRSDETMTLFDDLNKYINEGNCTVIGVIHENPGSIKARGHTGSESNNKASTVLRIENNSIDGSNMIKVTCIKSRESKSQQIMHFEFDNVTQSLRISKSVPLYEITGNIKIDPVKLIDFFIENTQFKISKAALIQKYQDEFNVSQRTARNYIKMALDIIDKDKSYKIESAKEGKTTYFLNVENKNCTNEEE